MARGPSARRRWGATAAALAALTAGFLPLTAGPASADVTRYANDTSSTGWYADQHDLSPGLVGGGTFGRMFSTAVSGQVYAQPVVSAGTALVVTENDNVYGIDATTGGVKWGRNVGVPWNASDLGCPDLVPTVGITGTPVVDAATGTAYFLAKRYATGTSGAAAFDMHAVSVATGAERPGFPEPIGGPADNEPGVAFDATTHIQRAGLLLLDGVVYAAFAGHCDHPNYRGWVFGVSTGGVTTARWTAEAGTANPSPGAGIWQSGGALVSDGPNQIVLTTGNGETPAGPTPGKQPPGRLGQAVVRLQVGSDHRLRATDYFAPYDAPLLDDWDADFGSGAPVALPPQLSTPAHPHLLVQAGKAGYVYLLDRDDLGGYQQGPGNSDASLTRVGPDGGAWSKPGVWGGDGGWVYVATSSSPGASSAAGGRLHAYRFGTDVDGTPTLSLAGTTEDAFGFGSSAGVVTSEGATSGTALLWSVWLPNASGAGAQLRAYDPVPLNGVMQLRWSAPIGTASKFTLPAVSGRRVYVGTRDGHLLSFGSPVTQALAGTPPTFPSTVVGTQSTRTLTLTAGSAVTVTGITSSDPAFAAATPSPALPAALAAGQSIAVPLRFAPSEPGIVAATLTVTTSAGTVPLALQGLGLAAGPFLSAAPTTLSLGAAAVGGAPRTGTVTLSNLGAQALTIQSVTSVAPPFSVSGLLGPGASIAAGASVTASVSFSPSTVGLASDEIDIASTGGPVTLTVSGTGATPGHLVIAPVALDASTVTVGSSAGLAFTLTNSGGFPVTITKSKPPDGGAFSATTQLVEGSQVPAGATLTETVRFAPAAPGPAQATWTINGDDGGGVRVVTFTGTGASPTPPSTWHFAEFDGGFGSFEGQLAGDMGSTGSTAVMYQGGPHVFYYDATHGNLRHASFSGTVWKIETLDGHGTDGFGRISADVGSTPSATVYADQLQVFYRDTTHGSLRHAWLFGTTWGFETLDGPGSPWPGSSSGNVGSAPSVTMYQGLPHVWYRDATTHALRHAWWTGTTWGFETLDGAGSPWPGSTTHDVGTTPTATLYQDLPHVWYRDATTHALRHAWWTGTTWGFETLDGAGSPWPGSTTHDVGTTPSATLYLGAPQVWYRDATTHALRHAWWTGTTWGFETLDGAGSPWPGSTTHDVGTTPVAILYLDAPQVWYRDATTHALRHAWWTGTTWGFETLDGAGSPWPGSTAHDVGTAPVALQVYGNVDVFYHDETSKTLRHAYWSP